MFVAHTLVGYWNEPPAQSHGARTHTHVPPFGGGPAQYQMSLVYYTTLIVAELLPSMFTVATGRMQVRPSVEEVSTIDAHGSSKLIFDRYL
jgi:hypothetical protein